jgi:pyruvate dehydrogenase E2 component (dihydrolipoamide acetyltransferase)
MSIAAPPTTPPVTSVAQPLLPASPAPAGPDDELVAHTRIHAGPAMRRLARELGVDLATVQGSGRRARIVREDVVGHVKKILSSAPTAAPIGLLPTAPTVDFSRFGDIDTQPLSKIRRSIGQNLHRAWITVPHVTQFDEADITDLEAFRKTQSATAQAAGTKLTLLAFLVKVVTVALARFPDFNASLAPDGATLILKKYCHIGIAANTPRGLLVPVLRDANRKGLFDIAREVAELGQKARDGKLTPAEMQGGCFTISSLGGVSGTSFTPIINVPEVAILGISPAAIKPVWRNGTFEPRLLLPLSLSYDHRVIDGVAGAEFTRYLGQLLGDIRQILL